jgi:predicted nucleic-acid-binding protein
MIAIDTNVVVRLLVNDDAAQGRRARSLLAAGQEVFVAPTVLLESEGVLRAAYGLAPDKIADFLRALLGLPGVRTAHPEQVALALAGYEQGMDFADALHLASSSQAERFYTFEAACRPVSTPR